MNNISPEGKGLEKLVSFIYETLKNNPEAEVIHDIKLNNEVGGRSQFDVIIRTKVSNYYLMVAVECKDKKRKISVADIRDFNAKCDLVKGIARKILVAVNGYQKGVIALSKRYGIELYSLEKVLANSSFNWRSLNSTKIGHRIDFDFTSITFYSTDNDSITCKIGDFDPHSKIFVDDYTPRDFEEVTGNYIDNNIELILNQADNAFYESDWRSDKLVVPISLPFKGSSRCFAVALNNKLIHLESLLINMEFHYIIANPSITNRQYINLNEANNSNEKPTDIISLSYAYEGDLVRIELIINPDDETVSSFVIDQSGDLVRRDYHQLDGTEIRLEPFHIKRCLILS